MDPKTCLEEANYLICFGTQDEAADKLREYEEWRWSRNGFEPIIADSILMKGGCRDIKGDEYHRTLVAMFVDAFGVSP